MLCSQGRMCPVPAVLFEVSQKDAREEGNFLLVAF